MMWRFFGLAIGLFVAVLWGLASWGSGDTVREAVEAASCSAIAAVFGWLVVLLWQVRR
jgi:uncharacterized protein YjeT (DUF2065 family)